MDYWLNILKPLIEEEKIQQSIEIPWRRFPWIGNHGFVLEIVSKDVTEVKLLKERWIKTLLTNYHCKPLIPREILQMKRVQAESYLLEVADHQPPFQVIMIDDIDIFAESTLYPALVRLLDSLFSINSRNIGCVVVVIGLLSNASHQRISSPLTIEIHRFGRPITLNFTSEQIENTNKVASIRESIEGSTNPEFRAFTQHAPYQQLEEDLLPILINQENNQLITKPTGMVIQGSSGSGKTFLVKWLISKLPHYHIVEIPSADLIHKEVGASERAVQDIYQAARNHRPSILLFENFDILFGDAAMNSSKAFIRTQSVLLSEIDKSSSDQSVLIIATVTDLRKIDSAFLRPKRLEETIRLQTLTAEEREHFLRYLLLDIVDVDDHILDQEIHSIAIFMNLWTIGKVSSLINEAVFNLKTIDLQQQGRLQWNNLKAEIERLLSIT